MQHAISRAKRAKTSEDFLRENRLLANRVRVIEDLLRSVVFEADQAATHPDIAFTAALRIRTLARQFLDRPNGTDGQTPSGSSDYDRS